MLLLDFAGGTAAAGPARVQAVPVGGSRDEHGRTPLHIAADEDRLDQVFQLLLKNASVNDTDKNGWTPLHCAANAGHLDVLTVLLNSYGVDVNCQTSSGSTVLHYVMRIKDFSSAQEEENYMRILDLLKQKGTSLNTAASRGITPLHEATLRGNLIGVKWLIDNGVKINIISGSGFSPLHFAVQSKSLEVVKLLVENNANPGVSSSSGTPTEMAKDVDSQIYSYLSSVPAPQGGYKENQNRNRVPARPARKITSASHRLANSKSSEELASPDDDDEEEVIYTLEDQDEDEEEDVPGSRSAVIPLAQVNNLTTNVYVK